MPALAACHCAAVRLTCEAVPVEVTARNGSICRRYGVLWAEPAQMPIEGGATEVYECRSIGAASFAAASPLVGAVGREFVSEPVGSTADVPILFLPRGRF